MSAGSTLAGGARSGTAVGLARRVISFSPRLLAPVIAAGTVSAACGIGLLATSGWLITRASLRPPVFVLAIAIGAVQAFALGRGLARYLQRLAVHGCSLDLLGKLRLHLYDALEPLVPGSAAVGSGEILTALVSDVDIVAETLAKEITAGIDVLASVVLGTAVVCLIAPLVGITLLAGAIATVIVSVCVTSAGREGALEEATTRAELSGSVIEIVRSAPELVAFGREDLIDLELERVRRCSNASALRRALGSGLGRATTTLVAGGTLVAVICMGLGAHDGGHISGVMLAAACFVTLAVLDQCAGLPGALTDAYAGDAAASRISRLAQIAPAANEPLVDGGPSRGLQAADLESVGIDFEGRAVLDDVAIHIGPGRRVAVVGPSGSGKTTAVHALLHFVECSRGRASIGSVDVRRITRQGIARLAGWMSESAHVFAAPLGDNLRLGRSSASDEQCLTVLERVGLAAWFSSLPDGLATMLGEGGRPLSSGERQRLGLARVLLSGPALLLLDEPTSHLDPDSADDVLDELLDAAGVRSVLVVSHEDGVDAHVDEVVSLDRGRVTGRRRSPAGARPPG